jgi:proline iminopeptidase
MMASFTLIVEYGRTVLRAAMDPDGRYLHCPNGSHNPLYDDQEVYIRGLLQFITDVDAGRV